MNIDKKELTIEEQIAIAVEKHNVSINEYKTYWEDCCEGYRIAEKGTFQELLDNFAFQWYIRKQFQRYIYAERNETYERLMEKINNR